MSDVANKAMRLVQCLQALREIAQLADAQQMKQIAEKVLGK
jgi:hypothetical protein